MHKHPPTHRSNCRSMRGEESSWDKRYRPASMRAAGGCASAATGDGIARWDGARWHAMGADSVTGTDGVIDAIEPHGDSVFIGGSFSYIGPFDDSTKQIRTSNLAVWRKSSNSWSAIAGGGKN